MPNFSLYLQYVYAVFTRSITKSGKEVKEKEGKKEKSEVRIRG